LVSFAGKLVLIPVSETQNLETLFKNSELKIHYYCDNYVIATAENISISDAVTLDENAFAEGKQYAIVYCLENDKNDYLEKMNRSANRLYSGNNFLIMQIVSNDFKPYKNDGMVAIRDVQASLPKSATAYPVITEQNEEVLDYISQVSTDSLMSYIQTLEDFETRYCLHPKMDEVRDWIKAKYESFGLDVSLHHFIISDYEFDNVITIQRGTEFPNEYVVCGAHYDSYSFESNDIAFGADDDASGTAGILETARILSQYDFKRSIIYCSFTVEELGLYGSGYFAEKCAKENMNIVGYFNLDMTGYLTEGADIHLSLIYPNSALTLANYFDNVSTVYFPEVPVYKYSNLPWGDSDHTSFNNIGYKGIWWFEDIDCDSPFIHHIPGGSGCGNNCTGNISCTGDIIGPSVNNPEQVKIFTQINVANVATLAIYDQEIPLPVLVPPTNCQAALVQNNKYIKVTWEAPEDNTPTQYNIYKNGEMIKQVGPSLFEYINTLSVHEQGLFCYTVTAQYGAFESDFSNEACVSIGITEYDSKIQVYPNPANDELRVTSYELQVTSIEVYDVSGRKHEGAKGRKGEKVNEIVMDISGLPIGVYFLRIATEAGEVVKKVVKE
jgi:hypothetical protein